MATSRRNKVKAEIEKARLKLVEQQARLKKLESKNTELENMEIVDIVRGFHIPLDDLAAVLQSLKNAAIPAVATSVSTARPFGAGDPKSNPKATTPKNINSGIDESDTEKEDETE